MKSIVISNKGRRKDFFEGHIYYTIKDYNSPRHLLVKLVEITDESLIFETLISKKIYRTSAKQFGIITKNARRLLRDEFLKLHIFDCLFLYNNFDELYEV